MTPHAGLKPQTGLSLIELLVAVAIAGLIIAGMQGLIVMALDAEDDTRARNDGLQQARFAMQTMVNAVAGTQRLMIPLGENPATAWSESVRDVLAVTLDPTIDRNNDGWADANNDKDYLDINNNGVRDIGERERIDEDVSHDMTNDGVSGIIGIDDNNNGEVDESNVNDDDEDGAPNEDEQGNGDEDGDGTEDEDLSFDMSNDNAPGFLGVDDDYDGTVDEGNNDDDDEDGLRSEDWLDPVVFFLNGTTLMQRIPNIDPVDGTDYTEYPIADNITQLQIERVLGNDGSTVLVDITLQISPPTVEPINLNTRVRVGGRL
ncbi:MAG: prepilin-type N-terminal cleavage/methylation domain-containing protein [Cycloclasticus sp.]